MDSKQAPLQLIVIWYHFWTFYIQVIHFIKVWIGSLSLFLIVKMSKGAENKSESEESER